MIFNPSFGITSFQNTVLLYLDKLLLKLRGRRISFYAEQVTYPSAD